MTINNNGINEKNDAYFEYRGKKISSFNDFWEMYEKEKNHVEPVAIRHCPLYQVYSRIGTKGKAYAEYVLRGGPENREAFMMMFASKR